MLKRLLFVVFPLFFTFHSIGQSHCGHSEMTDWLIQQDPSMLSEIQQFEENRPRLSENTGISRMGKVIPVVVHVIHSGESVLSLIHI